MKRLWLFFALFALVSCNGDWYDDCGYDCYDDGYYCDYCGNYIPPGSHHPPTTPPPLAPEEPCDRTESWQIGYEIGYEHGAEFGYCQGAPETDVGDYGCNTDYLQGYNAGCNDGYYGNPYDDTPPWAESS